MKNLTNSTVFSGFSRMWSTKTKHGLPFQTLPQRNQFYWPFPPLQSWCTADYCRRHKFRPFGKEWENPEHNQTGAAILDVVVLDFCFLSPDKWCEKEVKTCEKVLVHIARDGVCRGEDRSRWWVLERNSQKQARHTHTTYAEVWIEVLCMICMWFNVLISY